MKKRLSFDRLVTKLIINSKKVDYILKNYSNILFYNELSALTKNKYNFYYYSKLLNDNIKHEDLNALLDLNDLLESVILDFYSYYRNFDFEYLNNLYENVNNLLSDFKYYPIFNMIMNNTFYDMYKKIDLKKYDSFFNTCDLVFK